MTSYQDRRALVIGGLGFIGTGVVDRLRDLRAQVTVVTRSVGAHGDAVSALSAAGVRVIEADLRDAAAIGAAVRDQQVVFNLAAQSGAVQSMEDPWTDLDINCRGNLVLLEALREQAPEARLVFVSSRLVYGSGGGGAVGEERVPDPLCIHAVHKAAVEQYLRVYGRVYGLTFAVARLTNPYGPGQPPGRTAYGVVNRLIHLALAGEVLRIYGDGGQRRDYIYIDDAVEAVLRVGEAAANHGPVFNVGSGIGTPLVDMARAITAMAGSGRVELVDWPPLARKIETGDFVANIDRLQRELGWRPRVPLADGLQRTVAYYRAHVA